MATDSVRPLPLMQSLGWAALVCLGLFVILRPEEFSVVPNGLDPLFYTGLGINFDDAVSIGSGHYFISRWSAYYPLHLIDLVTGPVLARLVLRLVMATALISGLWHLRPRWTWSQRILAATLLMTMPMFVRAFFTDYVEHAFLVFLTGLVILALRGDAGHRAGVAAGVLLALTVVANPLAAMAAGGPVALLVLRADGLRSKAVRAAVIIVTALAVVVAGLVFFRWVHGIENIYQPTFDLMKESPGRDPLKSPRLEWLGRFTWLYLPPFMVALAVVASLRPKTRLDRVEWMAVGLCAVQFPIQWVDQFVRDGDGLEISYYWSMAVPSFCIALILVVTKLLAGEKDTWTIGLVAGWIALLIIGVPTSLRLPPGLGFAAIALAVTVAIWLGLSRSTPAATALVLAFVAWTQIGAPPYDPSAYHQFNIAPRYDQLFGADGDTTDALLDEVVWFEERMDTVDGDDKALFAPTDGSASQLVAIYHAHVGGQVVTIDAETGDLAGAVEPGGLLSGAHPLLVVVGDPTLVAQTFDILTERYEISPPVFDETYDGEGGPRLVVVPLVEDVSTPARYEADSLPAMQGRLEGDDLVLDEGSAYGYATFGPYVSLAPGRYEVTLHYSSSLDPESSDGVFDVSNIAGVVADRPLLGTNGDDGSINIRFEVGRDDWLWEFRTLVHGEGTVLIDRITVDEE